MWVRHLLFIAVVAVVFACPKLYAQDLEDDNSTPPPVPSADSGSSTSKGSDQAVDPELNNALDDALDKDSGTNASDSSPVPEPDVPPPHKTHATHKLTKSKKAKRSKHSKKSKSKSKKKKHVASRHHAKNKKHLKKKHKSKHHAAKKSAKKRHAKKHKKKIKRSTDE